MTKLGFTLRATCLTFLLVAPSLSHALIAVNDTFIYSPYDADASSLYTNDVLLNDDSSLYPSLCVVAVDNFASNNATVNAALTEPETYDATAFSDITTSYDISYRYTVGQEDSGSCIEITDISNPSELSANVTITFPAQHIDTPTEPILLGTLDIDIPEGSGLTQTESALLQGLDNVCGSNPTDPTISAQCSSLDANNIVQTLQAITPEQINGQVRSAESTSQVFTDDISKRMQTLRTSGAGIAVSQLNVMIDNEMVPIGKLLQNYLNEGAAGDDTFSNLGGFVKGTIGYGKRDNNGDEKGYNLDIYNITLGLDYRFTPSVFAGVALGYTKNSADFNEDRGDASSNNILLSVFANYYPTEQWYVDGLISMGYLDTKNSRKFTAGGTQYQTSGKTDGGQLSLAASTGYQFTQNAWLMTPYAQLEWALTALDQYTESGAWLYDLTYEEQELNRSNLKLGGQISYTISTSYAVWIPGINVDWQYQIHTDDEDYLTYLANDPSKSKISLAPAYEDKNFFNIGLSLSAVFSHGISAYATYDTIAAKEYEHYQGLTLGARMEY